MDENKPLFDKEYRAALKRANLSNAEAARQLGIKRSTLLKYLRHNRYPESLFPKMCALVGLRARNNEPLDCAEAEAVYAFGGSWMGPHGQLQGGKFTKANTLRELFSHIDAAQENGRHRAGRTTIWRRC